MQTATALLALLIGIAVLTWLIRVKKENKANDNVVAIDDTVTIEVPQEEQKSAELEEESVEAMQPLPLTTEEPVKELEEPKEIKVAKKAAAKKSTTKSKTKIKP